MQPNQNHSRVKETHQKMGKMRFLAVGDFNARLLSKFFWHFHVWLTQKLTFFGRSLLFGSFCFLLRLRTCQMENLSPIFFKAPRNFWFLSVEYKKDRKLKFAR